MNFPTTSIILTAFLSFLYVVSYIPARRRLSRSESMWSIPFFLNFTYLIYLTFFYQTALHQKLGLDYILLDISTIIMTVGAILHHVAIILQKKRPDSRVLRLTHGQISHLLVSVPYGINSFAVSLVLFQHASGVLNLSLTITYTIASASISTMLLLVGFRKIRLPY